NHILTIATLTYIQTTVTLFLSVSFSCSRHPHNLHSFPTRRSSDLFPRVPRGTGTHGGLPDHARERVQPDGGRRGDVPQHPFRGMGRYAVRLRLQPDARAAGVDYRAAIDIRRRSRGPRGP